MLRYKVLPVLIGALFLSTGAFANLQNKEIKRSFKVTPSTKIEVSNKFGKVHVNSWDKQEVNVVVQIEVSNTKNIDAVLESINIDFSHQTEANYLSMETEIEDMRMKSSFSINYTISVPKGNNLIIRNKFGDIYLPDLDGNVDIELGYGQLKAGRLNGNINLEMEFGSGMSQISYLKEGVVEIKYSKLTIDKAGSLDMEAEFSEIYSDELSSLSLDMKYGKLITGRIGSLRGNLSFSDFETRYLGSNINLDCKNNHVLIERVDPSVNEIIFEGKFSKFDVGLSKQNNFKLQFYLKFANLKQKGDQLMFDNVQTDKAEKTYQGYYGDRNKSGVFRVDSEYGDLELNFF